VFLPEQCGNFDCAILISMIEFNKLKLNLGVVKDSVEDGYY